MKCFSYNQWSFLYSKYGMIWHDILSHLFSSMSRYQVMYIELSDFVSDCIGLPATISCCVRWIDRPTRYDPSRWQSYSPEQVQIEPILRTCGSSLSRYFGRCGLTRSCVTGDQIYDSRSLHELYHYVYKVKMRQYIGNHSWWSDS